MSVRSGHETNRSIVRQYMGYSVIKVTEIQYARSLFNHSSFSSIIDSKNVHYDFCKEGDERKPSQHYQAYAKSVKECEDCIDNFINNKADYFTSAEYDKYVKNPNHKCNYAYGYDSLMRVMREHQKADRRIKILIEDRLTDANFHSACSYLANKDYEGFEKFVAEDCKLPEKFEVYTYTMRKRIKDPKSLVEGLNKVISDYLESQGVKDTEVKTKFIEDW